MSGESLIITRFSAMGDVAMCASVVKEFANQNPGLNLILVSKEAFSPFFSHIPNLVFYPLESKGKHKGLKGLYRLFRELQNFRPVAFIDLHYNLRSRILSSFFKAIRVPVAHLNKHRTEKKQAIRKNNKILTPLPPVVEEYAKVFRALGYGLTLSHTLVRNPQPIPPEFNAYFNTSSAFFRIAFAPFAQHNQKIYPLHKTEEVLKSLSAMGHQVFLFGGGEKERVQAEYWSHTYKNIINTIGATTLQGELNLLSNLDLMVSMDSSGMHMASLMGVRAISIWGLPIPT